MPKNKKIMNLIFVFIILILGFWHWGIYFLITILAISFLVFFHELGHFLAARSIGVAINTFSIGFGEKIYTKIINNTEYCISAIPLGGYVSLKGQEDFNPEIRNYDKDSYGALTPIKRIYILFAGPFFNIILAFFLYIVIGNIGVDKLAPTIGGILNDSPAQIANLKINDEILMIDDHKINDWSDVPKYITEKKVNLLVLRDGQKINISLQPKMLVGKNKWNQDIKKPMMGGYPSGKIVTIYHRGFSSIPFALQETYGASILIFQGFEKLIDGTIPIRDMGGIVAVADITSKAASIGLSVLLTIVALISINLGIMNLFPIPALDGGHIIFNIYEIIFRRPISEKVFVKFTYGGMGLLFLLMFFTTGNDLLRIFGR